MNIVVCMKQVLDTEAKIKLKEGNREVDYSGAKLVVNPYDEYAIEEALRIREKFGEGSVVLVTVGPDKAEEALRTGLAMGADRAIHVKDPALQQTDSLGIAMALAAALKEVPYDIILCGKQAVDGDCAQVAPALAELLDLPQVQVVTKLEVAADRKSAVAHRQVEGATVVVETSLPAVITTQKGINEPRYPSLPGIMKAKKKEVKVMNLAGLGLGAEAVSGSGVRLKKGELSLPQPRKGGTVVEGEPAEVVQRLIKYLREEAKLI